ncbi:hypothetical protein [Chryseobacterium sp. SN22]|uniref:hypothetical protein n=1 Tax=Chryseobacterium sp. SN22 TaxID=2606431 RepID=UPI00162797B7|nr:hypothetical protein [Chryseobacterium sp. SN22]
MIILNSGSVLPENSCAQYNNQNLNVHCLEKSVIWLFLKIQECLSAGNADGFIE